MDDTPKEEKATMFRPIAESSTVEAESIKRRLAGDSIKMDQRFCQGEQSIDIHTQSGVSSARNCTNVDALPFTPESRDEQTIWKNLLVPENHTVNINRYENAGGNQKNQTLWTPGTSTNHTFQAKEHTNLATESKQSTRSLNTTPTSTTEVENFVNDKHQFSPKMEPISFDIDSAMNIPNPSHGTTKADQLGLFEDFSLQSTYPINQQFFDNDNNFADFNALPPFSQIKDDPCNPPSNTGEGIIGSDMMDYAQQSPRHSLRYNNELCKTPIPTTYADSQVWCQSTSSSENQRQQKSTVPPNGIHNAFMVHSTSNTYSACAGILPMRECLICGDEASGCHYGVLTCGSCKVFFKRAVEGHHNYLCAGRNDCIVDKIRRKNCPSCRLRKCYQAGMMLGGRKLKRFGTLKAVDLAQSLVVYDEWQARASLACAPATRGPLFSPQILAVLESIEPEVVYAGHDNSQPELPHVLLNSLNRLCERQLLWIIRWSKSVPGFRTIHINDQMSLIQYSWMSLMVFSLGWRSFQNVTSQYLYFAPDLILNEERMRRSPIYDLCLAMKFIPQELANLQVTREEFLCMKALMLLNTVPAEGLKSQAQFEEVRQSYIHELTKAIHLREKGVVACSQRFYHLTKLMDTMHEIVKKVNLYCLSTFIQAEAMRVEFPEMMSEVITSQLPKVLAGTVKPLLFHGK